MFKPEGVYYAMVTPFNKDGKINEKELRKIVDFDIKHGVHGLFPISTSGEFIQMDFAEKVRMMNIVADQAGKRCAVTPGVTAANPRESIALAHEAEKAGCDAVVVSIPYYIPITQGMVEAYVDQVVRAVKLPVILYNIPAFTTPITLATFKKLLKHDNIVGMKDSSGSLTDAAHFIDLIRLAGRADNFNFFTGKEDGLLQVLAIGAKGGVTAASGIIPEVMVGIWNAFQAKDYQKAKELQFSVLEILRTWSQLPLPVSLKTALKARGFDMGEPVQPLSAEESASIAGVEARLKELMTKALGKDCRA